MLKIQSCLLLTIILILSAGITGCERKVTEQITEVSEAPEYLGSSACQSCHSDIYADFRTSGHPYKLNYADSVEAGSYYPYSDVPNPPSGYSWSDVAYVIGGYAWKARFIGTDGYIITPASGANQYNLADQSWSDYHAGETKPYACGPCHMTAYDSDTTKHQDNLPGITGQWVFPGVQCEECHGPGSKHAEAPFKERMLVDRTSAACGKCHIRDAVGTIPASGSFIRHHEQYNEIMATKKASMQCVDCHDPHKSARYNPDDAIIVGCENCHWAEAASYANDSNHNFACKVCHMPDATKSALAAGTYIGDVATHLFAINTDSTAEMIYTEGGSDWANGYLTLEYTCLKCHASRTKGWASQHADEVHGG